MGALLRLFEMVVRLLERTLERRRQRIRQAQRDELENDPVGFFDAHFNGVRERKTDAADKTDA